ncbi:hypothetical protein [Ancylobacter terrae]|uniref:hypothetical protein n=1 Tax=Ancylobacter sp. sgz301288 TaxID=3342077 RepID=UPI00385F30B6
MAGLAFPPFARCRAAAGSFLAGAALILVAAASPASAQYYSPFDYGYGPPPFPDEAYRPRPYRAPPYRPAPSRVLPQSDVGALLRSMGFAAITPARRVGDHYVADATDGDGVRVRIRLNRYSGQIASVRPLARGEPPLTPPANVRTPAPPKPTPAKPAPPQTAARPAPESPKPVPDGASPLAPAPQGQVASPESTKPAAPGPATPGGATSPPAAAAAAPRTTPAPQGAPPAPESTAAVAPPAAPAAAAPPVRVIPGVAVPPSAGGEPPKPPVPAAGTDAAMSAGLGAGTATPGDSVSAGTASVLTRDAAKPAEKSGKDKKSSVN